MELSNLEKTVVYLASAKVVEFTVKCAKTSQDKTAANVLKMFLDDAVKSGVLVEYMRKHELERGGVKHGQ